MKMNFYLALGLQLVLMGFWSRVTLAADQGVRSSRTKKVSSDAKLGTSFRFDGTTLRGKYQTSLGTTATVENDKYLEDLLGARKHFKDRLQKEQDRN
jgi:hypothetical protein